MGGLEGRTLDRYELKQMVGKGGMADVYLGYDPRFERTVAVKVFKRDDDDLLRRFIREAQLMANLRHAHLMPVYDTGESTFDGVTQYFIVMPFMECGTLRDRIRRSPLSLQETGRYLRQIADVLDYIHQRGIIHRDIKSSNVLLDAEDRCYLSDFGIARMNTDATMTITGGVMGTADYVAPELFEENRKANAYSDLYSLGIVVFEMVTRQLPFSAENQIALVAMHMNTCPPSPRSLVPSISLQTERVMLKALAKKPEQRYASASVFAEMFCRSLSIRSGGSIFAETKPIDPARAASSSHGTGKTGAVASSVVNAPPLVRPMPPARSTEGRLLPTSRDSSSQLPVHQPPPVSVPERKRALPTHARGVMVAILALFALLVAVAPMMFFSFTHHQTVHGTATPSSTPPVVQVHTKATRAPVTDVDATENHTFIVTKTARATATVTPTPTLTATARAVTAIPGKQANHATATATAIVSPTATLQAQISPTTAALPTATAGNAVFYSDPLNNPYSPATRQANWDQNGNCIFRSDGYHIFAPKLLGTGQSRGCMENGHAYGNTTISVDMAILSGHTGGVFFRASPALFLRTYAGYLFEVDSQGNYSISRSTNFITGKWFLKMGTMTTGFHVGYNVKNRLQIIANGSSLSFSINGVFLTKVMDSCFSFGNIAFLATSSDRGMDAEIAYSNLHVFPTS